MSSTTASIFSMVILGISILAFVLIGIRLSKSAFAQLKTVTESKKWPFVQGSVVSSQVQEETHKSYNEETGKTTYYSSYRPEIKFHYVVAGNTFTSSQRVIGKTPTYSDEGKAGAVIDKYPAGSLVNVYYDPDNPKNSVLEPGSIAAVWRPLLSAVILFGVVYVLIRIAILIL